jgi:hypothetical protein
MRSISYRGLLFTQPTSYWDVNLHAYLPDTSGIYAIQVPDGHWSSEQLEPIYFGETASFRERHVRNHHDGIPRWLAHRAAPAGLLISYCEMPDSSQAVREYMQGLLIQQFKPVCNLSGQRHERSVSLPELAHVPFDQDLPRRGLRGAT